MRIQQVGVKPIVSYLYYLAVKPVLASRQAFGWVSRSFGRTLRLLFLQFGVLNQFHAFASPSMPSTILSAARESFAGLACSPSFPRAFAKGSS